VLIPCTTQTIYKQAGTATNALNILIFSKDTTQWLRLEIISVKKGGLNDEKGIVEFKAYYLLDGEELVMNEISRFKKMAGRWFYLDGVVNSIAKVNQTNNQGKNALCSCGSGKKFKRCCGQS
jgi:SEC-C motif-containing protein